MPDWPQDTLAALVRPAMAELVAMTIFTYCGVGCAMTSVGARTEYPDVRIPLAFGLTIFVLAYAFGKISGAHINPAVTTSLLLVAKISPQRAFVYILAQMAGAFLGALALGISFGELKYSFFGITDYSLGRYGGVLTQGRAFFIEFMLSFLLLLVVNSTDGAHSAKRKILAPLAIGIAVVIAHVVAVPLTGCGINPARSFASCCAAAMFGAPYWTNHWIYWIAPILGGATATVLWQICFVKKQQVIPQTMQQ